MIVDFKQREVKRFKDIKYGDVYFDEEDCLCMKLEPFESNYMRINCCYIEN